jgi:hypothetical protein
MHCVNYTPHCFLSSYSPVLGSGQIHRTTKFAKTLLSRMSHHVRRAREYDSVSAPIGVAAFPHDPASRLRFTIVADRIEV